MLPAFLLALSLLPWLPAFLCSVKTEGELAVMEGQSLIVPCHYEPQYAAYVKYWCRGKMREFCTSLARTGPRSADPAGEKVSILDDPVQQVFTVTMRDLKEDDSGWYMCGVEIGGGWSADAVAYTYIKVIHGMSAANSRLSGEEGSSVSVECSYSERYRESEKKWCRSGDWSSCLVTGPEGTYDGTSVAISDDRIRTFTVTLKRLRMSDAGWFWCSTGEQQVPVHVQVSPRPTTVASTTLQPTASQSAAAPPAPRPIRESWSSRSHILESLMVCASVMLVVGLAMLARKIWKRRRQDPVIRQVNGIKARHNDYSEDVDELQNATVFLNRDSQEEHVY